VRCRLLFREPDRRLFEEGRARLEERLDDAGATFGVPNLACSTGIKAAESLDIVKTPGLVSGVLTFAWAIAFVVVGLSAFGDVTGLVGEVFVDVSRVVCRGDDSMPAGGRLAERECCKSC